MEREVQAGSESVRGGPLRSEEASARDWERSRSWAARNWEELAVISWVRLEEEPRCGGWAAGYE